MSKSKFRSEYEAMFGVVDGTLRLYDDKGNKIYYEDSSGYWIRRVYDAKGNEIYCHSSISGVTIDNRSCNDKVFIEEQSGKKFKMVEIK